MVLFWCVMTAFLPGVGFGAPVGLVVVWGLTRLAARWLGVDSMPCRWTLVGAMAFLGAMLLVNLDFFCTAAGATPADPYIVNPDAARNWAQIKAFASGLMPDGFFNYQAYGIIMSIPGRFLGLGGLLCVNALMTMLAIVFTGRIARESAGFDGFCSMRVAMAAMLMTACVLNFMAAGTILLKDAMACAAFAAAVTGCLAMRRRCAAGEFPLAWLLLTLAATALAMLVRMRSLYMLVFAFLALMPWTAGRRGGFRALWPFIATLVFCVGGIVAMDCVGDMADVTGDALDMDSPVVFSASPRGSSLTPFIEAYPTAPLWLKLVSLPFTLGLQLLLPLPWTFMRHFDYGPSMVLAHFGFPLYIEAGLVAYFLLFCIRRAPRALVVTTLAGFVLYAGIAFLYGGTVSRYSLMLLPMLLPSAAWVAVVSLRERRLAGWIFVYGLVILIALTVGYYYYSLAPAGNDLYCCVTSAG